MGVVVNARAFRRRRLRALRRSGVRRGHALVLASLAVYLARLDARNARRDPQPESTGGYLVPADFAASLPEASSDFPDVVS